MNAPSPVPATVSAASRTASAFRPGWALTAQVAVALVTVLALATWQFSRGLEKTALKDAHAERLRAEPVPAATYTPETPDFTRVSLAGRYDAERTFIVGSRQGRGVQIISPLHTQSGVFLVNRGWLLPSNATNEARQWAFDTPSELVDVVGVAWPPSATSPHLAAKAWPEGWPKRIVGMDVAEMAREVDAHAREVRLERDQPGVLRPASLAWDYSPSTHWGYVVQWLLIGVAVVVGYVVIGKRRGRQTATEPASLRAKDATDG